MAEHFKKGQMIPKRFLQTHRKTRVNVRFGCDVVVDGHIIYPTSEPEKGVICADLWKGRRWKNGTIQRTWYAFKKFSIDCSTLPGSTGVRVIL